eukprot:gene3893-15204_t
MPDDIFVTLEVVKKCDSTDVRVSAHAENPNAIINYTDATEAQLEYLENQSCRSSIRITDVVEDKNAEKSWHDTKRVVKQVIKDKLNLQEDFEIERCHRVNRRSNGPSRSGRPDGPRLIVAKLAKWKDKECILKKAREIKPDGIKFLVDLSWRTMIKREEQVPEMLAARKQGKITYFVLDKLVIKDKPPDQLNRRHGEDNDPEVSFRS